MATRPAAARRRNARIRRDEARTRIAAATEALLARSPYRDLSVDAVMTEAGLSRTVFYRHYDGLPEVVLELFGAVVTHLRAELEQADMHGTIAAAVDAFAEHGPLMRAVDQAAGHDAEIEAAHRAVVDAFTTRMGEMLAQRMAEGAVRPGNPHELARALNLMNHRYLLDTVAADPTFDRATARDTLLSIWEPVCGAARLSPGP